VDVCTVQGPGPRTRNAALEAMGEPVLHAVPGYVLSSEMHSAQLLVLPPAGATVVQTTAESVGAGGGTINVGAPVSVATGRGFVSVPLSVVTAAAGESSRGRVRLTVQYSDKTASVAHYYVLPSFSTQVDRLGHHMAHGMPDSNIY
jgi:hypothetical protein